MTSTETRASCARTAEKTEFLTTDRSARLWFAYPSIPGRTKIKLAFAGPNGLSYSEYNGTVPSDGDWCFWKDFDFTGVPAPALPGQWNVRATLDDVEAFTRTFRVTIPGSTATLSQTTSTPSASGGRFTVNVTATGSWFVIVNVPWISIVSPANGSGNATVTFTVAANTSRDKRTGVITIAGQTFTVTQDGTPEDDGSGSTITEGLPAGAKCVSGPVDYVLFSLATRASRLADEVSIGGVKLCPTCPLKPPLYGNFAQKLEAAGADGLNVDACYDSFGTMNFLRMRQ